MDDMLQISIQILSAFEICLFIGDKLRLGLGTLQSAIGEAKQGGGVRENKLDVDHETMCLARENAVNN